MDPFAIYDDHYKKLREAVSDAVCDDQIDALTEATQVRSYFIMWDCMQFFYVFFSLSLIMVI